MTKEEIEKQMWVNYDEGYKAGCSETIDKVCKWLRNFCSDTGYLMHQDIEEFKKYMEEQQ